MARAGGMKTGHSLSDLGNLLYRDVGRNVQGLREEKLSKAKITI